MGETPMISKKISLILLVSVGIATVPNLRAQAANGGAKTEPKAEPDVLIFTDGEKLIGQLVRSNGASLTFKSDMAGEVTVDWGKVQELHTHRPFAVVKKDVKLRKKETDGQIPRGDIDASSGTIRVAGSAGQPPAAIPVAETGYVLDETTFEKAVLSRPGIFAAWKGAVSAGASLVTATQNSRTFTGAVSLIRAVPTETWLDPRNRTSFNYSSSYGKLSQPGKPDLRTAIYHADGERDQYFTPRLYGFGQLAYDHNSSQGLDLQQNYGGGVGWTVLKSAVQTLDLKSGLSYVAQQFQTAQANQNLLGSTFAERYDRKLPASMLLDQQLSVTPAWNNTRAYSAGGSTTLTIPVYKRLSLSLAAIDTFLNNPPPTFKKNSFQFTTGLTYTLP